MADNPSEPGWPFNEPPPIPDAPPTPPPGPTYEPAPAAAPSYEPPAYQPPAPQPAAYPPPAPGYQPPPPPGQYQQQIPSPPNYGPSPVGHGYPQQPVPPPPPAGWNAGYPPQPKKSRKNVWITLGVMLGILALAIGACSVWLFSALTAPVDASNEFLAAVDRRDYAVAVAMTEPSCNRGLDVSDLNDFFGGQDIRYDLNSSNIVNSSANVTGSLGIGSGSDIPGFNLSLRKVGDDWRVCGFGY